jgi:hypothetical protein
MKNSVLLGLGRHMISVSRPIWQRLIARTAQKETTRLASVRSREHHLVHNFVVREIPRLGEALSPEFIGQQLDISVERVNVILDELEKKLILFRAGQEAVIWAYPATADKTPHHLTFSTGEQGYAA